MTSYFRLTTLAAGLAVTAGAAHANVTLTGTYRDFTSAHPNFGQGSPFSLVTGAVKNTLGADGTPDANFVDGTRLDPPLNFTTSADLEQWYSDNAFNTPSSADITLVENGGKLEFQDTSFFPLGAGNYLFTLQLAGFLTFADGDTFEARSDDDLWIFVDGKLALDLGGVHAPTSSSFSAASLVGLGLTAGQKYALDIFYAERNVEQAELAFSTNMDVSPVPVPAAGLVLATALGGLALYRRRRQAA